VPFDSRCSRHFAQSTRAKGPNGVQNGDPYSVESASVLAQNLLQKGPERCLLTSRCSRHFAQSTRAKVLKKALFHTLSVSFRTPSDAAISLTSAPNASQKGSQKGPKKVLFDLQMLSSFSTKHEGKSTQKDVLWHYFGPPADSFLSPGLGVWVQEGFQQGPKKGPKRCLLTSRCSRHFAQSTRAKVLNKALFHTLSVSFRTPSDAAISLKSAPNASQNESKKGSKKVPFDLKMLSSFRTKHEGKSTQKHVLWHYFGPPAESFVASWSRRLSPRRVPKRVPKRAQKGAF
jgi:hypothetical protein